MKHPKLRIAWSAIVSLGVSAELGCESSQSKLASSQSTSTAPSQQTNDDNVYAVTIPLTSVASTASQADLSPVQNTAAGPYGHSLHQMWQSGVGASNVYLVDAPTLADAINASSRVIDGDCPADVAVPLNMPDAPRGNYWLVAFLGVAGSGPTHWLVDSISVTPNKIRFSYHRRIPGGETKDEHPYLYWAPLGKLEFAAYTLELYDTGLNTVTLMRRVEVKPAR